MIMSCPSNGDIKKLSERFINENVKDETSALEGAKYIIAEWISDNASFRKYIRSNMYKYLTGAFLISRIEELPMMACMFETASAVGTVGLSFGITPGLGSKHTE